MFRGFKDRTGIRNIRQNLLLILSSFAFMCINLQRDPQKIAAFPVALVMILFLLSRVSGLRGKLWKIPAGVKAYAALSAVGICLYAEQSFIARTENALKGGRTTMMLIIFSAAAAVLSLIAVYTLSALLLDHVTQILAPMLRGLSRGERAVTVLITLALMGYSVYAFAGSRAFWNSEMSYEVIYTSDSPSMIEPNVFLWLYHPENDIRQPLFAVFSAPLTAPAYLLSIPFARISAAIMPTLMNLIQVALLVLTNLMLTGILRLNRGNRICFMLISAVLYPTLLFSVMIEQYIIAYFWLIFAAFSRTENRKASLTAVTAAGGTLLTSLAFAPLSYDPETDGRGFRSFFLAMVKAAAAFLSVFLAFGRMDTVLDLSKKAGVLASFAGGGSLTGRINQYLAFVASCFTAPDAAADTATFGFPSWQMTGTNILHTNWAGVLILLLCAVSLIVNRRERAVRIAGCWVGFSMLLLLIAGWGAPENGMILYTLYFGWAFLVLLFRLADRTAEKTGFRSLTPLLTCTIVAVLGWINFSGIGKLLAFAFSAYPV